jgi:simple sugar transport system permease protein
VSSEGQGPLDPQEERLAAAEEQLLETPEPVAGGDYAPSVAARMALMQRAGGIVIPVVTTIFAFAMAMIVIAVTGHNPFKAFKGIFDGTGLNWLFPWVWGSARD